MTTRLGVRSSLAALSRGACWATSALCPAFLVVELFGCSGVTEPVEYSSPQLANIKVDPIFSMLKDSGLVVVSASPVDSLTRPGPDQRLRVSVRSATGDSEAIDLGPALCGDISSAYYCSDLGVTMKSGHHATELQPTLDRIGARFWMVSVSGTFAGVWVFDRGRRFAATLALASQPSVSSVERDFVGWAGSPSSAAFARMNGALPLDFGPPVRGDGRLHAQAHDTLHLAYLQPDGSTLARAIPLP